MIKRFCGMLILLTFQLEGRCQNRSFKEEFEYTLNLLKENRSISDEILINLIPNNESEFESYYAFYSDFDWKNDWEKINKKIGEKVYQGEEPFFTHFMNLSAFVHRDSVEDEFLTDFYYDIDFVIENNSKHFCEIYPTLKSEAQDNTSDWLTDYCE